MIPVIVYILATKGIQYLPKAQQQSAMVAALHANPLLYASTLFIGGGCSILGGYVAAWIARRDYIIVGVMSSFLCVGSELFFRLTGPSEFNEALWLEILFLLASPAFGALGGYLRSLGQQEIAESA
jgi:hypothetical protein